MNRISINGVTIAGGRNVSLNNGRIVVDGVDVTGQHANAPKISVEIHGDVDLLSVDSSESVTVHGQAGVVQTLSGPVTCGDVAGSISTMSGSVRSGNVAGSIRTMSGDVRHE